MRSLLVIYTVKEGWHKDRHSGAIALKFSAMVYLMIHNANLEKNVSDLLFGVGAIKHMENRK